MVLTIEKICTGAACGKQRIRVSRDDKSLIGFIQVTTLDCSPVFGATTVFVVQGLDGNYELSVAHTLYDALMALGLKSIDEFDAIELPDGIYNEYWHEPYKPII